MGDKKYGLKVLLVCALSEAKGMVKNMKENNSKLQRFPADFQLLMSCVESNQENFNFLIHLMRRNVVIPFIGAGFSKNFKYPLWG